MGHVFQHRLKGAAYRDLPHTTHPQLLDDVPLQTRVSTWFMYDDASPHFTIAVTVRMGRTWRVNCTAHNIIRLQQVRLLINGPS
jgi:hypothetical protein